MAGIKSMDNLEKILKSKLTRTQMVHMEAKHGEAVEQINERRKYCEFSEKQNGMKLEKRSTRRSRNHTSMEAQILRWLSIENIKEEMVWEEIKKQDYEEDGVEEDEEEKVKEEDEEEEVEEEVEEEDKEEKVEEEDEEEEKYLCIQELREWMKTA